MERKSPVDIIPAIINALRKGEQTLSKLSRSSNINRVTLSQYVQALEKADIIISNKKGRERIIKLRSNPGSYFDLPIKEEDNKYIETVYAFIKETCLKLYQKQPTKTQVYKILWEIRKEKNIPIGWYQYGPCPVKIYKGNEKQFVNLSKDLKLKISKTVKDYCSLSNAQLQKKIYNKEHNQLYLLKEELITSTEIKKDDLNKLMFELIKNVPKEAVDITTDFARTALLLGWENTKIFFRDSVWKYIALVMFKESLKDYYGNEIEDYLKDRISDIRSECEISIYYMVRSYTDSKYSQDEHYQSFLKMHQNVNH